MRSTLFAMMAVLSVGYPAGAFAAGGGADPQPAAQIKPVDPNFAQAKQYYQQALAIDARHLGAHEYIGEAYLMLNRPADAQQHLARLDSLCVFGCTEYRMLKTAIANYNAGKRPTN
jgi:hypothetical protein